MIVIINIQNTSTMPYVRFEDTDVAKKLRAEIESLKREREVLLNVQQQAEKEAKASELEATRVEFEYQTVVRKNRYELLVAELDEKRNEYQITEHNSRKRRFT